MQKLKNANIKKIIRPLAMILVAAFLLVYSSYGWIRRQWTPTLEQKGITIATGDSLAFIFAEGAPAFGTSLNNLLGIGDFTFKSVSNATGKSEHFFALQYDYQGVGYEKYNILTVDDLASRPSDDSAIWTSLGRQYGYIEVTVRLYAPGENVSYVYIDDAYIEASYTVWRCKECGYEYIGPTKPDSCENCRASASYELIDPSKCVRVSISFAQTNLYGEYITEEGGALPEQTTLVFASDERCQELGRVHTGITTKPLEGYGEYAADGQNRCTITNGVSDQEPVNTFYSKDMNHSIAAYETTNLHRFDDYNGENENYLFAMEGGSQMDVTVRIWLEGVDENCTDVISGKSLDLMLRFAGKKAVETAE